MKEYLESIVNDNSRKALAIVCDKLKEYECSIEKDFRDFTEEEIDDFIKTKYNKCSETTLANVISHLKNLYSYYEAEEITKHLNLNYVRSITQYKKHNYYSPEEIKTYVERLYNDQDKALVMLVYLGLYDENFETIRNLRESQIKEGYIQLNNGTKLEITPYIENILRGAMAETFSYKYIDFQGKDIHFVFTLKENTGYLFRAKKIKTSKEDKISLVSLKKKFQTFAKFLDDKNFTPITIKNSKTIYDLVKLEVKDNFGLDVNQMELKRICKEENKKTCIEQLNVNKKEMKHRILEDIFNSRDLFI